MTQLTEIAKRASYWIERAATSVNNNQELVARRFLNLFKAAMADLIPVEQLDVARFLKATEALKTSPTGKQAQLNASRVSYLFQAVASPSESVPNNKINGATSTIQSSATLFSGASSQQRNEEVAETGQKTPTAPAA